MNASNTVNYTLLSAQAQALLSGQRHTVANAANLSALLYLELPDVNWVGFYFLKQDKLILGPFQGKPACVEIPLGSGVCGTAASLGEVQRVDDVHQFDGHIVCDSDSASELVIPLFKNSQCFGVLDIDSPVTGRFSSEDEAGLELIARAFEQSID